MLGSVAGIKTNQTSKQCVGASAFGWCADAGAWFPGPLRRSDAELRRGGWGGGQGRGGSPS